MNLWTILKNFWNRKEIKREKCIIDQTPIWSMILKSCKRRRLHDTQYNLYLMAQKFHLDDSWIPYTQTVIHEPDAEHEFWHFHIGRDTLQPLYESFRGKSKDFPPEMNVANLYVRRIT